MQKPVSYFNQRKSSPNWHEYVVVEMDQCRQCRRNGHEIAEQDQRPGKKTNYQAKGGQTPSRATIQGAFIQKFSSNGPEGSSWLHIPSRIDASDRMDQLVMLAFNQCWLIGLSHGPVSPLLSLELSRSMKCSTYYRRNKWFHTSDCASQQNHLFLYHFF